MYKRILLAYDGSREGRLALREGAILVRHFGSEAFLLAVVPPATSDLMGIPMIGPEEADRILAEGLERGRELGVTLSGKVVHGEAIDEIAKCAEEISADLVIVGHRKRSFLDRWWSGPSHSTLSDRLSCSLLISCNPAEESVSAADRAETQAR